MEMENNTEKKPIFKKWWLWAIIVIIAGATIMSMFTGNAIEIIGSEKGEYGKETLINKGTYAEKTGTAYYLPVGTYTVKNLGDEMMDMGVYDISNKDSVNTFKDQVDYVAIDKGSETEMEIKDGWIIMMPPQSHLLFKAK